jgi:hypothetical protein
MPAEPDAWDTSSDDGTHRLPAGRVPGRARTLGDRILHRGQGRPWRSVHSHEPGLEPRAERVVAKAEQVHGRDVRVALRGPHERSVDDRLGLLVRTGTFSSPA